jgi:hypothetical protein
LQATLLQKADEYLKRAAYLKEHYKEAEKPIAAGGPQESEKPKGKG